MGKKLYVGNLSFGTNETALNSLFSQFGTVESVKIITDRDSGRSKGFGFIEMSADGEAQEAISKLNGTEQEGRTITVSEAKPEAPRGERKGGFGGRPGGGGGNRGGFGGGRKSW